MTETDPPRTPPVWLKLALEIGPLAAFFLAFSHGREIAALIGSPETFTGEGGPLFLATAVFMGAIAISLGVSWWTLRVLPRMAVVTGIVVVVFGGLTLWLRDETFIKMKPTIVNALFALILGVGLLQGRSYLRYLMAEALPLDDAGWMIFTKRWAWFFVFLAILNEVIWRTQTTEAWVDFKTFANLPITFGFMAAQIPLLRRHMVEEKR